MKLGSREADAAYDRWHDRMADAYFGADEQTCPICDSDQSEMDELIADAERFRALREWSGRFAERYAEAKAEGIELADVVTADIPGMPGIVAILSEGDFTEAVDGMMRPNAELTARPKAVAG